MRIGIDLMGGDQPPQKIYEAILEVQKDSSSYFFVAIAHPEIISTLKQLNNDIEFVEAPEFIEMHEMPLMALRRKKQSSMAVGLDLLKNKRIDAFVSTGNTGALIGSAVRSLPLFEDIDRPALLALLPSELNTMAVLDVGANVSSRADQLVQFALLGAAYQESVQHSQSPKIGLLNIGVEEEKGTEEVRKAYQLLQEFAQKAQNHQLPFFFMGNIEGREAFQGHIDVLVTDGFSGNIFLKTSEGIATFMLDALKKKQEEGHTSLSLLNEMHQRFNYAEYPGALLCGVEGLVIKCHGNSNLTALSNGIKGALKLVQSNPLERFQLRYNQLNTIFKQI